MVIDTIAGFWTVLASWLEFVPNWVFGIAVSAIAVVAALAVHRAAEAVVSHLIGTKWAFARSLFQRTRRLTRVALVLFAVSISLRLGLFNVEIAAALAKLLLVGFIMLAGWMAIIAAQIASDIYLVRFKIDSDDNLLARKHVTQVQILRRAVDIVVILLTLGFALALFDPVRQIGVSLFASAGVAGLVAGLAARPVLGNLIAGIQIAITQPIRIDDVVVLENEWGWISEITPAYVVVRLWDWRRLVVPLTYFIEKPFQNWTREGANIIGSVFLYVDHSVPVASLREKLEEIVRGTKLWDGQVVNLQVTDVKEFSIELRALVSAANSPAAWDLRCEVREKLIDFLQREYPGALPRRREDVVHFSREYPREVRASDRPGGRSQRVASPHSG